MSLIERHLSADRVRLHYGSVVAGSVQRYVLAHLGALNFVLRNALGGGLDRSLSLDTHGKCPASLLLDIDLPD